MLNIEELLIKTMQILDFDMNDIKLKQTIEKRRFFTQEESLEKYREHITLIVDKLNINFKNEDIIEIFRDLLYLYFAIHKKLNSTRFIATEEKVNWVLLKRLVIPYLAKRFSKLDSTYEKRRDIGLSGGKFWYLPDITNYPNVKLPMNYIMDWWLDLYGRSLDLLCSELDNKNSNDEKPFASKNTIKEWFKKSIPDRKSIEEYCSVELDYQGTFFVEKDESLENQFDKSCDFILNKKKLTIMDLKNEVPFNSLIDKIFGNIKNITKGEKQLFVKLIAERWSIPTSKKLINYFLIARSSQSIYKNLLKYFSFKESIDIEENKLLQLIYLYIFIYRATCRL